MKSILKNLVAEFHSLAWTLAGAATVLITLSGQTKTIGIWISGVALVIHLSGIIFKKAE
jgi:hypothetical protein